MLIPQMTYCQHVRRPEGTGAFAPGVGMVLLVTYGMCFSYTCQCHLQVVVIDNVGGGKRKALVGSVFLTLGESVMSAGGAGQGV